MVKLPASTAGSTGLIPGGGTKTLHALRQGQKIKIKINRERGYGDMCMHMADSLCCATETDTVL